MKKYKLFLLTLVLLIPLSFSCRRSIYNADISGVNCDIRIKRLEKDLFETDPAHLKDSIAFLRTKYDGFIRYFGYVINIGETADSGWADGLVSFCTDRTNNEIYQAVITAFPSVAGLEKEMNGAFRRYMYYFPSKQVPAVYTCLTGFNNSIITGDSVLAVSLDKYLGPENKFYHRLQIYKYQLARMKPANIMPDCIYSWASSEWDLKNAGYEQSNVLSDIIHEGKLLFFTKCLLPDQPDEEIFGFSADQLKFCRRNEGNMWQYLVEHSLLFSSDMLTRKKLTGEAPFTSYFSNESPGRAAAWIGFRIVESYMEKHRSVTLSELMGEKDIQSVLDKAKYRPRAAK
jgi:hypothetical protein